MTRHILVLAAAAVLGGSAAQAATVTMDVTNGNGQSWATATCWNNDQAAAAGNDYVVTGNTFTLRSPGYTTGVTLRVFPGDSLTINSAQFNLSSSENLTGGVPATVQVNDLRLQNGGVIVNSIVSSTTTLTGALTVNDSDTAFIRTAGIAGAYRHIIVDSQVNGGATLQLLQGGSISITNAANGFDGTWTVGGSATVLGAAVSSTATTVTTLRSSAGLGASSSMVLNSYGHFDADYAWSTAGALTINNNALVTLDQNLSVGSLTIAGTEYAAGTYAFATLNANHDALFTDAMTGSITVVPVPEPTAMAVLGVAGLLMMRRRS